MHPAIALIRQGAFTSTPVNPPKWAFNLQYLAFIQEQFLSGIPNYSAWCNGTVAFLTKEGCQQVPSAVSQGTHSAIYITHPGPQSALARPLSSSLLHYQLVLDRIRALVEQTIWRAGLNMTATSNPKEDEKVQAQPIINPPPTPSAPSPKASSSLSPDVPVPPGGSTLDLSKEAIQKTASDSTLTKDNLDSSFHQPQGDRPSPYLRKLCPLCFNWTLDRLKEILKGVPNAAL